MRALYLEVSEDELEKRHRLGIDMWDEMWEGVLHVVPPPGIEHQFIVTDLMTFLRVDCDRRKAGRLVVGPVGVFEPGRLDSSYRVPDAVFVATGNESVIHPRGIVGGPDAVIEVRSPADETYDKFEFLASLGVREVIVIIPEGRRAEVYRLAGKQYVAIALDRDGWVTSEVLGIRMRPQGQPPVLRVEALDDPAHATEI